MSHSWAVGLPSLVPPSSNTTSTESNAAAQKQQQQQLQGGGGPIMPPLKLENPEQRQVSGTVINQPVGTTFLPPSMRQNWDQVKALKLLINNRTAPGIPIGEAPWTYPVDMNKPGVVDAYKHGKPQKNIGGGSSTGSGFGETISGDSIPLPAPLGMGGSGGNEVHSGYTTGVISGTAGSQAADEDYEIHSSDGSGDCLFDSVRQALLSTGFKFTVRDLRKAVADTIMKPTRNSEETIAMWHTMYKSFKKENERELMAEYEHVSCIEDYKLPLNTEGRQKLYKSMMSKDYWGEEYAINVLERLLHTKFLIFDGNEIPMKPLAGHDHGAQWKPKWYCAFILRDRHYVPVSQRVNGRHKFMFTRVEIPKPLVEVIQEELGDHQRPYISLIDENAENPFDVFNKLALGGKPNSAKGKGKGGKRTVVRRTRPKQ